MYKESTLAIKEWLLPETNKNCRPGIIRSANGGVVIHWVANPKTSPMQNAKYWSTLTGDKYGSAHYIIGMEGTVLRTLPEREVGYHVGAKQYMPGIVEKLSKFPNYTTVGIELTHPDWSGRPTEATYKTAVILVADILTRWKKGVDCLYLHRDITNKLCHRWFVDNPNQWEQFKKDVRFYV